MFSQKIRILAFFLMSLMVFYVIPVNCMQDFVSALTNEETATTTEETETPLDKEIYVLGEDISKREESAKHFRMSDGSYIAVQYEEPVHYLDENGDYVEYDNTLTLAPNTTGDLTGNLQSGNLIAGNLTAINGFKANKSDVSVTLANSANQSALTSISKGEYSVSILPLSLNTSSRVVVNNTASKPDLGSKPTIEEASKLYNHTSSVKYVNLFGGADLEYVLSGSKLKENIIVNETASSYVYSFTLNLTGLYAVLNEDGSISLIGNNTDKVEFTIPAGYMFDDAGNYSEDVTYTLTSKPNGNYILTVTASSEWINSNDRVFPVTVDPTLFVGVYGQGDDVSDTYVASDSAWANSSRDGAITLIAGYVKNSLFGNSTPFGTTKTYIKLDSLPEVGAASVITSAELILRHEREYQCGKDIKISVKEVSNEAQGTITWNNQPTVSNIILDYENIEYNTGSINNNVSWDITAAAKKWYEDSSSNKGLCLEEMSGNTAEDTFVVFFSYNSIYYPNQNGIEPMFKISYRDTKGLDSRWTYSSFGAGNGGTGNINLFNGNLVMANGVMSTNGNILPVEIVNVYNTYLAKANFDSNMKVGYGWQLSVQEKMEEVNISDKNYIKYTTSTGTELYFVYENGLYLSEDGYPYYITKTSTGYVLTDDYGNQKEYNSGGKLASITDLDGNKKIFIYSNNRLEYINKNDDSALNRMLKFEYNSLGYLKRVTNLSRSENYYVEYQYSSTVNGTPSVNGSGYLRKIVHSNGSSCSYGYNVNGLIESITDNETGISYNLEYSVFHNEIDTKSYRVKKVTQIASDGVSVSNPFQISYEDKKTVVRTWGTDEILNNSDDIFTTYVFDSHGRTISAYSSDVSGKEIYGASNAEYQDIDINNNGTLNEEYKKNNKISKDGVSGHMAMNLLNNGNLEDTSCWSGAYLGDGKTLSISSEEKYLGNKSSLVTSSVSTGYMRRYQSVTLEAGTYTLSAYVKTVGAVGDGAYLKLGNSVSEKVTGTTSASIENGWKRISVTVSLEAGTYQASLYFENATGSAYFDCVQLEKGETYSKYNLVDNGNMEKNLIWSGSYASDSERGQVAYISGDEESRKYSSQYIYLGVDSDTTTFMLKGWGKANSATLANHGNIDDTSFRISAEFYLTDETGASVTEEYALDFNSTTDIWQYGSTAICFKAKNATVNAVRVFLSYDFNVNSAWFDDVSLTIEPAQTYTYDNNGHMIETTSADGNTALSEYEDEDSPNDISKYTNILGEVYEYTYKADSTGASTHKVDTVTKTSNDQKVVTKYDYDQYGNVTSTTVSNETGTKAASSSTTYSNEGNYIASVTDENNITFEYLYDPATNLLTLSKDGLDNTTRYVYDSKDRIIGMFDDANGNGSKDSAEAGVEYSYTSQGYLSNISTLDTSYLFSYDAFGNNTSIRIDGMSSALATYVYGANNGKLQRTTYGNGVYVENVYDTLDRIVAIKYNGVEKYTFKYNGDGLLSESKDLYNNYAYTYEYDSLGRLIRGTVDDLASSGILMSCENKYDRFGRPESSVYVVEGKTISYSFAYYQNSSLLDGMTVNCNGTSVDIIYSYDDLERISDKTVWLGANNLIYTYAYKGSGLSQGTLIDEIAIRYENDLDSINFLYSYDGNGNITQIKEGTTLKQSYVYDSLNQLIRENNAYANRTYVYTYDTNGNILTKKEYTYSTGSLGTLLSTVTYTYGNEAWGDLLTNYNGTNISYDEIGNPLNWHNVTSMTWTQGRRLTAYTYTENGKTYNVSLTYNGDGIRISKIVINANDATDYNIVSYTVDGTSILKEDILEGGSLTTLYYIYDASGDCIGFKEGNRETYLYGKNAQGDVVALFNADSELLARYYYDAWGRCISVKDSSGNEITDTANIALINPIRYRSYHYESDTGFYYLNSRYYDPQVGRFINADVYVSTGQGIIGNNMFAYCGNNPVNRVDITGQFWIEWYDAFNQTIQQGSGYFVFAAGVSQADTPMLGPADVAAGILIVGGLLVCGAIATCDTITFPEISNPKIERKSKDKAIPKVEEKDDLFPTPDFKIGTTYYHVTTIAAASAIIATGMLVGSVYEGGYVYAWKSKPCEYAIKHSGAHMGITISFKTNASFVTDTGVENLVAMTYGPVVSARPGPIYVWDVQIVG